jgi:hypothetical protein
MSTFASCSANNPSERLLRKLPEEGTIISIIKIPEGYTIGIEPSAANNPADDLADVRNLYGAVAPDGSKGPVFRNPLYAAHTAWFHAESGQWTEEGAAQETQMMLSTSPRME